MSGSSPLWVRAHAICASDFPTIVLGLERRKNGAGGLESARGHVPEDVKSFCLPIHQPPSAGKHRLPQNSAQRSCCWKRHGSAEIKAAYLVMGRYDLVVITEAPDDETAAKASLAVRSQGNVKTETLRACTEEEYRSIISALP